MRQLAFFIALSVPLFGQAPNTSAVLQAVEKRYNSTTTLQAEFTLTLTERGRRHLPERGVLSLSKGTPSRMRWDYSSPAGNFFLSDGKFVYDYDKLKNEVTRYPYRETEDLRIPLSFLLGKLDFNKDFERFNASRDGDSTLIAMIPRNKKVGFRDIAMTVGPDSAIRRVVVTDPPGTLVMEYVLGVEQRNVKVAESLFKFAQPPGSQVVDVRQ